MSRRHWQDRVRDILDAIAEIQEFTQGLDYERFKDDDKSVRAVEMNFIIIGEAENLAHLSNTIGFRCAKDANP